MKQLQITQRSSKSAFSDVSAKCRECKIGERDGHEKVMEKSFEKYVVNCQVCGNPVHSLIWYNIGSTRNWSHAVDLCPL